MTCAKCGQSVHASTTHFGANGEIIYYHDDAAATWACGARVVIPLAAVTR